MKSIKIIIADSGYVTTEGADICSNAEMLEATKAFIEMVILKEDVSVIAKACITIMNYTEMKRFKKLMKG